MPWTVTNRFSLNRSGTQPLHSPALRWTVVPSTSIVAAPLSRCQRTVTGNVRSCRVCSSAIAVRFASVGVGAFLNSSSLRLTMGLGGPDSSACAVPLSKRNGFRMPPNCDSLRSG